MSSQTHLAIVVVLVLVLTVLKAINSEPILTTTTGTLRTPPRGNPEAVRSPDGKENDKKSRGNVIDNRPPPPTQHEGNGTGGGASTALTVPANHAGGWDEAEPFHGGPVGSSPPWRARLNTATFIDKIDGTWFIVDCWHHRILLSNDLEAPLPSWGTLQVPSQEELIIPHSMASDGRWVLTESSNGGSGGDNHTVLVYTRDASGKFTFHKSMHACPGNKARRPHRLLYHKPSRAFYLYLTSPPHIAKFAVNSVGGGEVEFVSCEPVPALMGSYARSITIKEDSIYVTAGRQVVTELSLETLEFRRYYDMRPLKIKSDKMNDLTFIDGWWYATSTLRCNIFRFRRLDNFAGFQVLTGQLNLCYDFDRRQARCRGGTPYYVTKVAGRIFVPYIFHCSGMVSFIDDGDTISDIQHHWGNGWVEQQEDLDVRGTRW